MIRLYRENAEFGAYCRFDTETGRLEPVTEETYRQMKRILPQEDVFEGCSETHTRFPRRIYFQITRRCNLLCPYCFIRADSRQHDLPRDALMNAISYLGRNGLMEARLTGGEPTLVENFPEIVDAFRKAKVYVSVATNGLWKRETLDFFGSCPNLWLIVSIDGDERTHNAYRAGSYRAITENLKELRKRNRSIRIRINTVLTTETICALESVFRLAAEIQAESVTFIPLRPQVRNEAIREKFLDARRFQTAIRRMIALKEQYHVNFTTTIETIYKKDILPDSIFRKQSSCAAGREGTNLDFDFAKGRFLLYGCSYSPASDAEEEERIRRPFLAGTFPFGEMEQFAQIWENDRCWAIYRDMKYKSAECFDCRFYRTYCTGSCPIQNINFSALNAREDVQLQIREQLRQSGEWYCYRNFL